MQINSGSIKNLHKRFPDRDLQPPVFILSRCKNYFCQTLRGVRKNVKKLIFHVLWERPFSMQRPKMNMSLRLKNYTEPHVALCRRGAPPPVLPASCRRQFETLNGAVWIFSAGRCGVMFATPNYIRHLILNRRYLNLYP